MFFNDIFSTIAITFLISLLSIGVILLSTILFIIFFRKNKDKKLITQYIIVLAISIFGIYISIPWIFLNEATHSNNHKVTEKYYKIALKTSVFPKVKATIHEYLASHYYTVDKNLPLAIENCEKFYKLKGDLPSYCPLWDMYLINKDYDKAIEQLTQNNMIQMKAVVYLLKGDTQTAIETISEKITIYPQAWDYAYRANFYSYAGKSDLAQIDYKKAIELDKNMEKYPKFNQMHSNKNYFFDQLKKNRKEYNLD